MPQIILICLLGASIIHLLPLAGILGAAQLSKLYGIDISDPNLLLLMRHRAVLFGLIGCALLASAFYPSIRPAVILVGLISTVSFVLLAGFDHSLNPQLLKVYIADVVAIVLLTIAAIIHFIGYRTDLGATSL